jgi:hypothetical protein
VTGSFSSRIAEPGDQAFIQEHSGGLFAPVERYIEAQALFLIYADDACAGAGLLDKSN